MVVRLFISAPSYEFEYNKKHLRSVMRAAGAEIARVARAAMRGSGAGIVYRGTGGGPSAAFRGGYRKGRFQASAPGQAPAKVTGTLAKSIRVRPFKSGEGVAIRDTAFYAVMLEGGAKGGGPGKRFRNRRDAVGSSRVLLARPFLSAALTMRQNSIAGRIQDSIRDDVAFVRVK